MLLPCRVDRAVNCRSLERGRPVLGHWETRAPRHSSVTASFHHDRPFAVPFRINDDHGFAIFEQHGGRMPEVLPRFPIHDDLAMAVGSQVHIADPGLSGKGMEAE